MTYDICMCTRYAFCDATLPFHYTYTVLIKWARWLQRPFELVCGKIDKTWCTQIIVRLKSCLTIYFVENSGITWLSQALCVFAQTRVSTAAVARNNNSRSGGGKFSTLFCRSGFFFFSSFLFDILSCCCLLLVYSVSVGRLLCKIFLVFYHIWQSCVFWVKVLHKTKTFSLVY